ncbi:hypothetical protein DFH28DRAFT_21867 [Melampsora americana]|nr:hypothetical protein DFH28DRAFT_21867 [Melampsora americana]
MYPSVLILAVLSTLLREPGRVFTMSLDRRAGAPLPPALYLECDGGSLSEMCLPDTEPDDLVRSLKQFTPEHLFYTTRVGCKFTCWTETGGQNIPMSREMFGEIIKVNIIFS